MVATVPFINPVIINVLQKMHFFLTFGTDNI